MHSAVNWALLGLVIERPSYAYELAFRFERTYEGALSLSSVSHVYTALGTLRDRGMIEETPSPRATARSRRRFQATPRGIDEHAEWLVGQVVEERRRQRLLVLQLGTLARTPERALAVLDAYEQACLAETSAAPSAAETDSPGMIGFVGRLIGEETRLSMGAKLRWAEYARTQLLTMNAGGAGAPRQGPAR